jgi:hypothetical protein
LLVERRPVVAGSAAVGAIVFLVAVSATIKTHIGDAGPALAAAYVPTALAERSWTAYVRAIGTVNAPTFDVTKLPTMAGLIALACCALAQLRLVKSSAPEARIAPSGNGADASRRIAIR